MASGTITVTEADYLRIIIHGTTAFELLRTALEFELFEHLEAAEGMDIEQVAKAIGVEPQPARILLLGLASLRLLEKEGDTYVNSEMARRKLLRASPRFLGPLVDIQADIINQAMGDFSESMRQNTNVGLRHIQGPGTTLYERLTAHPELQEVFYRNMGDASKKAFAQILDRYDFSGVRHVIDIGGGDGTNSIELARRYPQLEVTVFDQESVTQIAAQRTEDAELSKRMHFRPGDLFTDPLPEGADAVMFFHIFEIWSLERNTQLLRKCYDALPPGGVCLVYNFVSNDEGTGSMSGGLVSPYFLTLASGEGMTYAPRDMDKAIRDAGFSRVERYDDLGFSHSLVVGHK
ncbi:methyltransferase [Streptomyces aurantiacus]|uniref:O-methyltransferase n=1 Tax=Streptomyces aurantiacus TaxID=47760 RepID=A0A7G1PGQ0_9ACTN|nr:methyltransferase [Streptomyces aurantiacus]BCL32515.1 O-methyltransferase [Streptomyces aurantiacus]